MGMSTEDRYQQDPMFHTMVDMMFNMICEKKYTPTEMREAAMLASIMFEQHYARPPLRMQPMKSYEDMVKDRE
jgi:hypothetical protein